MANPQKEVWELIKAAKQQGWRVKETKKGYFLFDPSGRHRELVHRTPSDWRTSVTTCLGCDDMDSNGRDADGICIYGFD
jgi:hypothetical protein